MYMNGKDWSVRRRIEKTIGNLNRGSSMRAMRSRPNYEHPRSRPMKLLRHRGNRQKILPTMRTKILLTRRHHLHVALVKLRVGIPKTARPIELLGSVGRGAA
jgi:hypothetical protein